jgi:hypothetical protein
MEKKLKNRTLPLALQVTLESLTPYSGQGQLLAGNSKGMAKHHCFSQRYYSF